MLDEPSPHKFLSEAEIYDLLAQAMKSITDGEDNLYKSINQLKLSIDALNKRIDLLEKRDS